MNKKYKKDRDKRKNHIRKLFSLNWSTKFFSPSQSSSVNYLIKFSWTDENFVLSLWAFFTSSYNLSFIGSPIVILDFSNPTGNYIICILSDIKTK